MDMRIPDMSGFDVMAVLVKEFPSLQVIAIPTSAGEEDVYHALVSGGRIPQKAERFILSAPALPR
jgi:CheY-like chemotaxis protein